MKRREIAVPRPNPVPSALAGSAPALARRRCAPLPAAPHELEALAGARVAVIGFDASPETDRRPGLERASARTGPERPAR